MTAFLTRRLTVVALLLLVGFPLYSQVTTQETANLRLLFYDRGHEYIVPHLIMSYENALRFHKKLFQYTPTEKVTVLLQDFGDYGNGGATAVPTNLVSVGISPFHYAYETSPANERMTALMNHELVHIVALDQSTKADRFWQSLFLGKPNPTKEDPLSMFYGYLATPRRFSPRWYHEGIAAFLETWMAGGIGRAMGSYDEMVFRTAVRDGAYIYDVVGLESEGTTIDFMVKANSYLYGTRFMSYLAYHYGPESVVKWVSRPEGSGRYFSAQFEKVFGKSLDDEWARWIQWEYQWQRANLDSIRKYPVTTHRQLSERALGSVSRSFYDPSLGKIFVAINYPGQVAHVASIDVRTGKIDPIVDVKGAALYYVCSAAYDPTTGSFFYTTDNNKWRDLNVVNVRTGETTMLIQDVRTGDLAFNRVDKSLWGIRHLNGISTIVRIPPPYREWNQVYSLPYGKDMFDLDISPDGTILTGALAELDGTQRLVKFDIAKLLKGDTSFEVLYDFEISSPATFTFSEDGRYVYGSTYYTGVSNIVRYDFQTKKAEWLTNTETGYFRPVPISKDSMIAFYFTGNGFVPVSIAIQPIEDVSAINFLGQAIVEKHPVVMSWHLKPPTLQEFNPDSLVIFSGTYNPTKYLRLMSGYPIVEGYKNFAAFGFRLNFSDYVLLNELVLTGSYTPNKLLPSNERWHVSALFKYWRWNFKATYNWADFYDLFGPTKVGRKGYSLGVQYREYLVFDEPKLMDYSFSLTKFGGLERLPEAQNITVSFDNFWSLSGKLSYQYTMRSLGSIEEEKGVRWQLLGYNNYVNGKHFARMLGNFDYGILLPIHHSSIWFRTSAGYSFGDRREPLANFFFGGFGNNWVDYQDARRFREYYSFPGVALNAIGGTNYGKLLVEWTLPPLRFRRLGFTFLYSNWTQLMLFSSGIVTNFDDSSVRRTVANAGAQLDFKLVIFSTLESTLSVGYARAAARHQKFTDEFMVSLKLLK